MTAFRFSANTGFLWKDRPFLDRIRTAAASGFDAVEFHDEAQSADPSELREVLDETGMPVMGLNVRMGETSGCAAIAGMADQARRDIDAAVSTAGLVGAPAIHVLAGKTEAPDAGEHYRKALSYALRQSSLTVLIEPICRAKMPGYFLHSLDQAAEIIADIAHPRLKILFDCFHIEQEHGDALSRFRAVSPHVGHVQIASFPDRSEPWPSRLDYSRLLPAFRACGYDGAFGCEYTPATTVEAGLGWLETLREGHG